MLSSFKLELQKSIIQKTHLNQIIIKKLEDNEEIIIQAKKRLLKLKIILKFIKSVKNIKLIIFVLHLTW